METKSALLKSQYALIPNRHDPYRYEELQARGLVTADSMVPMGIKQALTVVEQQVIEPAPQRGVVMWVADLFRRKR